jgi:hypothetical protein
MSTGTWSSAEATAGAHRRVRALVATRPVAAGFVLTCLIALFGLAVVVGNAVLLHPQRGIVGANPNSDFQIMTWSIDWWPWAIAHGADPLHTHLLWAPGGFPTLWITGIPAVAFFALPLTLTLGPLFAYNALMFAAVALAAGCAYLLCHELTGRIWPAVVGGLMFGLSPYMLGHTLSQHLNLTFVWPIPLIAWAIVRRLRGRWQRTRTFVLAVAGLLVVELGSSLEMFLDLTIVLAIAFLVAMIGAGAARREVVHIGGTVALAYCLCLPFVGAVAYLALTTSHGSLSYPPADYSIDVANVVIPTPLSLLGAGHTMRGLSRHFVGNIGEQDGYLGLPALVLVLLAARARWRQGAWFATSLLVVILALSLGPLATIQGRPVVGLPFSTARLPVLADVLPARLSLFTMLLAACLCAAWLALDRRLWVRAGAAAVVVVSLLPNFALTGRVAGAWAFSNVARFSTPRAPVGFGGVAANENVLVLPAGSRTAAMYWQVESGMQFRLALAGTPFVPPRFDGVPAVTGLVDDTLPALDGVSLAAARLRVFLVADHIDEIAVAASASRAWPHIAAAATHSPPRAAGGFLLYAVPPRLPPLRGSGEVVRAGTLTAWLRHDGRRAHVDVALGSGPTVAVSAPSGDAELTAAAVGGRGRAAVVFTEWRDGALHLRVATHDAGRRWHVVTLDRRTQPMWSPRALILADGTTVVSWIDEADPLRLVRVAVRTPSGRWRSPMTLDDADGLASVEMAPMGRGSVLFAWHDGLANEERVRVATYSPRGWTATTTVGSVVGGLARLRIAGRLSTRVEWRAHGRTSVWYRKETT